MKGEGHSRNANPGNSGMYVVATMIIALGKLIRGGGELYALPPLVVVKLVTWQRRESGWSLGGGGNVVCRLSLGRKKSRLFHNVYWSNVAKFRGDR